MGHPHNSDKVRRIVASVNSGRDRREVAAEFGVTLAAVKTYLAHDGTLDVRDSSDDGPHCGCGLRLFGDEEFPGHCYQCAPRGGLHAVDFMRSGDAAYLSASLGKFRDS